MTAMAGLPEPETAYALLIGTETYEDPSYKPLPACYSSVEKLTELLTATGSSAMWQLPARRIKRLGPAVTGREARKALKTAVEAPDLKALIVCISCHGQRYDEDGYSSRGLHLAMTDSISTLPGSCLRFDEVSNLLGEAARDKEIGDILLIVDACWSDDAKLELGQGSVGAAEIGHVTVPGEIDHMAVPGAATLLTLTATSRRVKAWPYLPGTDWTAFLGSLIGTVEDGIRGAGEILTARQVFTVASRRLTEARNENPNIPEPRIYAEGVSEVPLCRNKQYREPVEVTDGSRQPAENEAGRSRQGLRDTLPPQGQTESHTSGESSEALLLRIYIPSERLYAAEARRLLSLFREWLIGVRGRHIRQSGYRTVNGEVYELYAEGSAVQPDLRQEFGSFSGLLRLCSKDPVMAADMLASAGVERASSAELVANFGKEIRRLEIDLRHEWERRMLTLRHSLEGELADNGVDLPDTASNQIATMLERVVPGPSVPESLALLMATGIPHSPTSLTVNINPQIIKAMESTIIQNVQGVVNLGPRARELLALVNRFGGQETSVLQSAVYELEDTDAPPEARSAAKRRLKQFLGTVRDIGVDLLEKYLEHKAGL
jgi:hypothetical protein